MNADKINVAYHTSVLFILFIYYLKQIPQNIKHTIIQTQRTEMDFGVKGSKVKVTACELAKE